MGVPVRPRKLRASCSRAPWLQRSTVFPRRSNEAGEQRMAVARSRGEFRMELAGHEPRMIRQFDEFHQAVGRESGKGHAGTRQLIQVMIVEFVAMAVPLVNRFLA